MTVLKIKCEIFVKLITSGLLKLKDLSHFCFPRAKPDDMTASSTHSKEPLNLQRHIALQAKVLK